MGLVGRILFFVLFIYKISLAKEAIFLEFEKQEIKEDKFSKVTGTFLYIDPNNFYIEVTSPVFQKIYFKDEILYIYYPKNNLVFKFYLDILDRISFHPFLFNEEVENLILKLGYKKISEKDDEINYISSKYGKILIKKNRDKTISHFIIKDKDEFILLESSYKNYKNLNNFKVPQMVSLIFYDKGAKNYINQKIFFKEIKKQKIDLKDIFDFSFLSTSKIKEIDLRKR